MSEISGLTSADAMALLRHTLEQLETHLDDPDNSSLSGQGMLEAIRDRLSTLYALVVNLTPAPPVPDPGGFGSAALAGIQSAERWQDTRDDEGRWLPGAGGCPRGCGHVLMAHRTDVGCVTCDCEHGIPGRGAELIDREKSPILPADQTEDGRA